MLAYVLAHLEEPVHQQISTDGAVVITGGEPTEVIVRLTERAHSTGAANREYGQMRPVSGRVEYPDSKRT